MLGSSAVLQKSWKSSSHGNRHPSSSRCLASSPTVKSHFHLVAQNQGLLTQDSSFLRPSWITSWICFSHPRIHKGHRNELTPWHLKFADPFLQNMDTALPDNRTDNNTRMSPPSPAFSLDSSSPFANGLHFESILFEDEEEDEDTGPRSSHEKPCSSPVNEIATSTNPKQKFTIFDRHHHLSKGKRRTKACMSMKKYENHKEESGGDRDPASLECIHDDVTMASSHSNLLLLGSFWSHIQTNLNYFHNVKCSIDLREISLFGRFTNPDEE